MSVQTLVGTRKGSIGVIVLGIGCQYVLKLASSFLILSRLVVDNSETNVTGREGLVHAYCAFACLLSSRSPPFFLAVKILSPSSFSQVRPAPACNSDPPSALSGTER